MIAGFFPVRTPKLTKPPTSSEGLLTNFAHLHRPVAFGRLVPGAGILLTWRGTPFRFSGLEHCEVSWQTFLLLAQALLAVRRPIGWRPKATT
jgi:hypothetical protein